MTTQGAGNREHGTEDTAEFLRRAMPRIEDEPTLGRDLWPAVTQRIRRNELAHAVPWFDWALAGGVAVFAVAFPAAIPVLFYYL
jgi:hypothetical protein